MKEDMSLLCINNNLKSLTPIQIKGEIHIKNDFISHLRRQSFSPRRIKKYRILLNKINRFGFDPMGITKKQIDDFFLFLINNGYSDETSLDYWLMFRKVVLFHRPELKDFFKNYKIKKTKKKINILTLEEIQSMIDASNSFRNKVLLLLLYEAGLRIGELIQIKPEDVIYDEHGALILVNGKTGFRNIRVTACVKDLKKLFKKNPKAFQISNSFINNKIIKPLARKVGIKKRVYAHLFRHTRATHLAKVLTDREMCLFFGWSPKSDMPSHYAHLSFRDLDEKMISLEQK